MNYYNSTFQWRRKVECINIFSYQKLLFIEMMNDLFNKGTFIIFFALMGVMSLT